MLAKMLEILERFSRVCDLLGSSLRAAHVGTTPMAITFPFRLTFPRLKLQIKERESCLGSRQNKRRRWWTRGKWSINENRIINFSSSCILSAKIVLGPAVSFLLVVTSPLGYFVPICFDFLSAEAWPFSAQSQIGHLGSTAEWFHENKIGFGLILKSTD